MNCVGARNRIREEFTRNKSESDPKKISELLKVAKESEEIIRTKVVQAEQVQPHLFSKSVKIVKIIYDFVKNRFCIFDILNGLMKVTYDFSVGMRGDHLQEKCVNARERCADCTCGM
jgi:hypothetical protein